MKSIRHYLESKLKLLVNEQKSQVVHVEKCSFLGFTFKRGKIRWTDKSFQKFKRCFRELTGRSWRVSMDYRMMKLGTNKHHAILSARSRKSYWHLSRSFATQSGMTNEWLGKQGLVSIKKLWRRIHYPATAR